MEATIVRSANACRNARAVWLAVRERAAARFHQQRINVAMITAIELDDLVAFGESARQPEAGHRRLCAAVHHPHFFDRRHPCADQFRHFHFERIGNAETDASLRRIADRANDNWRRMPENRRSPAADVIDVFVAIDVPNTGAFRALDEKRFAAHGTKCAHRRIHAAGNSPSRAREKFGVNSSCLTR